MRGARNEFHAGVLAALSVVYDSGHEQVAEEIVRNCGPRDLLAVAESGDYRHLSELRAAVSAVRQRP
jgi:hypothetical protein